MHWNLEWDSSFICCCRSLISVVLREREKCVEVDLRSQCRGWEAERRGNLERESRLNGGVDDEIREGC